ncbi:uncharacterized protein BDW70DRAFT_136365 [Aspergillus foveolatus]|uniref:uncharacterized protein n=1 Tax=Aspergillus foveolatus TaxID=210207 RepID=UPI003CCCA1CE
MPLFSSLLLISFPFRETFTIVCFMIHNSGLFLAVISDATERSFFFFVCHVLLIPRRVLSSLPIIPERATAAPVRHFQHFLDRRYY